jgi:hypothetical protein
MHKLDNYVGRIVYLKQHAYRRIIGKIRTGVTQENCFLVAAIDRQMNQLICYGAGRRINARATEIVLV